MEVIRTLRPGQHGTIKLQQSYGDKLVAVRYRLDKARQRQYTTIEIIVDERTASSSGFSNARKVTATNREHLALRIEFHESELRQAVKQAGAYWDAKQKVWWLQQERVVKLRLMERVVKGLECPDLYING